MRQWRKSGGCDRPVFMKRIMAIVVIKYGTYGIRIRSGTKSYGEMFRISENVGNSNAYGKREGFDGLMISIDFYRIEYDGSLRISDY